MLGILLSPDTRDLDISKGHLRIGEVREQTAAFLLEGVPGSFGPPDPMLPTKVIKQMHFCSIPADRFIPTPSGYELTFK